MIDTSFLNQLNRFSLIVNKRVTSNFVGEKRSVYTGKGTQFKDHRIYAPGDDIRAVDWKVYARTDDLYVKQYEEDRSLSVHLLVDSSASMHFGHPNSKFEYASMLGIGFAYLAMKSNEKFQFATFADDVDLFRSRRGMRQIASMVTHLNTTKPAGQSKLYDSLFAYRKQINSRSFIVIISDLLFDLKEVEKALSLLDRGHDVKLIQVLDRVERDMLLEGDLKLKDSESGGLLRTFISNRLKSDYQNLLDDHVLKVNALCNQMGVDFYTTTSDVPVFDVFFEILRD